MSTRILICTGIFPPDIGGPASYAPTLAAELMRRGHEVTIVTYSSVRLDASDADRPYRVVRVWKSVPRPFRHVLFYLKVRRLARAYDAVYTLNAVSAGLPALWAARAAGKKLYVKVVGDYAWEIATQRGKTPFLLNDFQASQKSGKIKKLYNTQIRVCSEAEAVIVPSQYLKDIVVGWGLPPEKVRVIYNGVDFHPLDISKEEARKHIGIPGTILLSSGRCVPWKGFKMLIKIMPQLLEINQFFRLVIVGDGPEFSKLQNMVRNLGLDKKVYLVGRKTPQELAYYLASADMYILNSGYEGFSHQLLEALTAGVPVIASAAGGNKELIDQGKNGFLVKYNDEFNLIEAVKGLWKLPELREQFSVEGKHTIAQFTVGRMLEQTIALLTHE